MTDRELLELAAKAAGLSTKHKWNAERLLLDPSVISLVVFRDGQLSNTGWNPLANDGDALRLAVNCGMAFKSTGGKSSAICADQHVIATEMHGEDPYAATRLAIVRAAAEIGKAKP